ncbi:M56 family metallopeptidase [Botrimarina mediterranea]|uniref:Regulatory protein BlaR1 n=1 Tax=Botrimarina mediterranea TaxID=2528022 RepID=A0A518KE56_9BACT|nr:M56 family metallopeptidase [Botrimarina mediterranea]QDV76082.1 Regulatory protein BlaR1 [Botrimarina mediterranea]QDV80679.1 Regulatory protein BlaR1 [Planctomycetes bacterium K2D]
MSAIQFLQWIASYAIQSALVIGVAAGLERWSSASTTKTRVWTACFVSLLGLLAVGLLLPHLQLSSPWTTASSATVLAAAGAEKELGTLVLWVWLFGVVVMVARLAIHFVLVQWFINRQPRVPTEVDRHLREMVTPETLVAAGKPVEFRIGPEEIGPFCYQFHRPHVFIPASLLESDSQELRHVLEHELTHLRTEHPLQLFLQKTTQCVLWFHPLVWVASNRANLIREFVCDDAASNGGAATAAYLRTLLAIVERQRQFKLSGLALGRSVSEVRVRAARLVAQHKGVSPDLRLPVVAPTMLAALAASLLWLPIDPFTSSRSILSPWPTWSAATLHALDLPVRDFQTFHQRYRTHELLEDAPLSR